MGFSASDAVKPLDYNGMGEYGIPDGTIAEPSNEALAAFIEAIQDLAKPVAEGEPEPTGLESLAKAHVAASNLCSGTPTAEQFAALPPRLFREFIKWLASEFIDPKS
jgi:hypothetical protein